MIVDCAGAHVGGAARLLHELDAYLYSSGRDDVTVIGRGRSLTPRWMAKREWLAHGHEHRIALNNVAFLGGERRTVLLRNALHFSADDELSRVNYKLPQTLRLQTQVVRATALHATRVIVPCTDMRDRVLRRLPSLSSRAEVRFHPVTSLADQLPGAMPSGAPRILVPIVPAPYKRLNDHARLLREAAASVPDATFVFTASVQDLPSVADDNRFQLVGVMSAHELAAQWKRCHAAYFPTAIESFGYPLAEARVLGRRVIALDTQQNREIAGAALAAFARDDADSLASAIQDALSTPAKPDPFPFDRNAYFEWLLQQ